jgi:transcriptional regulator with XRE-family HTH domain
MRGLADMARQRLASWMAANPKITQTQVAHAVGVTQGWVSRYRSGEQDADLDQLAAMARVFGHTLTELLDLRPDPKEQELIDAYRRLRPEARPLAVQVLQTMSPQTVERGRTRARNDGK